MRYPCRGLKAYGWTGGGSAGGNGSQGQDRPGRPCQVTPPPSRDRGVPIGRERGVPLGRERGALVKYPHHPTHILPPLAPTPRTQTHPVENMAHISQSRPASGLGLQVEALKIFQVVPFLLGFEALRVGPNPLFGPLDLHRIVPESNDPQCRRGVSKTTI